MPGFDPLPGLPSSTPDFTPDAPDTPSQPANLDQLSSQFASLLSQPAKPPSQQQPQFRFENRSHHDRDSSRTENRKDDDKTGESHGNERAEDRSQSQHQVFGRKGQRDQEGDSQGDESGGDGQQNADPTAQGDPQMPAFGFGDAILRSLGGSAEASAAKGAAGVTASDSINQLADQVASRILVSDTQYTGQMEVRIQLKDSILPGTEVQITQVNGEVQIKLVTESNQSFDVLSTNAEALKTQLKDRLDGKNVQVEVSMQNNSDGGGDGRSRNRRDLNDEYQQAERGPAG